MPTKGSDGRVAGARADAFESDAPPTSSQPSLRTEERARRGPDTRSTLPRLPVPPQIAKIVALASTRGASPLDGIGALVRGGATSINLAMEVMNWMVETRIDQLATMRGVLQRARERFRDIALSGGNPVNGSTAGQWGEDDEEPTEW